MMATDRLKYGDLPESSGARHEIGLYALTAGSVRPALAHPKLMPKCYTFASTSVQPIIDSRMVPCIRDFCFEPTTTYPMTIVLYTSCLQYPRNQESIRAGVRAFSVGISQK